MSENSMFTKNSSFVVFQIQRPIINLNSKEKSSNNLDIQIDPAQSTTSIQHNKLYISFAQLFTSS
jgi:hypothetical protein